jgi:transposase
MAWTEITRRKYCRDGLRYASNLTDAEWALIEPLLPSASQLGRPRETELRSVVDAILYMASTGCQWRQLPKEFSPDSTVQGHFYAWSRTGVFASINHLETSRNRIFAPMKARRDLSMGSDAPLRALLVRFWRHSVGPLGRWRHATAYFVVSQTKRRML